MVKCSIATLGHLFILLCTTLPFTQSNVTFRPGVGCITSSGTRGRCVALDVCPKLKAIDEKPHITNWEINLLIGAANACSPNSEQFCCAYSDIKLPGTITTTTTTTTQAPTVDSEEEEEEDVSGPSTCLQKQLGMDDEWIGRASQDSSFGVFITHKEQRTRCVGSLITPEYVLTAAHCVQNQRWTLELYVNALKVRADEWLNVLKGDVEPMYVKETIIHDEYNSTTHDNDIALLRLEQAVGHDESVPAPKPICIPMGKRNDAIASAGSALNCFGWGSSVEGKPIDFKQWMTLERISQTQCQARMDSTRLTSGDRPRITQRHICTVTITGNDAFSGFSGGPLMYRKHGTWYLIGLINYGVGRTNNAFPVVSLNVQQYTGWILNHIRQRQEQSAEEYLYG